MRLCGSSAAEHLSPCPLSWSMPSFAQCHWGPFASSVFGPWLRLAAYGRAWHVWQWPMPLLVTWAMLRAASLTVISCACRACCLHPMALFALFPASRFGYWMSMERFSFSVQVAILQLLFVSKMFAKGEAIIFQR